MLFDFSASNLENSRDFSASKLSLFDKMGTIKQSAKMKIKSLRKAVSLDKGVDTIGRTDSSSSQQKRTKTPVLKSLKNFFGKKKNKSSKHPIETSQR